jgi:hypothetical protein
MNGNGAGGGISVAQQLQTLRVTFRDRGLVFRHFPQATCKELRSQAGREVLETITMPDGEVQLLPRFELVGWASTRDELVNQLA